MSHKWWIVSTGFTWGLTQILSPHHSLVLLPHLPSPSLPSVTSAIALYHLQGWTWRSHSKLFPGAHLTYTVSLLNGGKPISDQGPDMWFTKPDFVVTQHRISRAGVHYNQLWLLLLLQGRTAENMDTDACGSDCTSPLPLPVLSKPDMLSHDVHTPASLTP